MNKKPANGNHESGNVFLIILLGVVMFASLAFVVSRSMRSETATGISKRQAELAAVDILSHAQRIERAVTKLRSRGISENDIDFTNNAVIGYAHTPPLTSKNQIFALDGGGVTWKKPESNSNDGSDWLFTGESCVVNVGTGAAGCASNLTDDEELLAVLPNVNQTVCEEINKRLGISPMPSGGGVSTAKFTGSFSDGTAPPTDGRSAACFVSGGNHYFYYVLLAR